MTAKCFVRTRLAPCNIPHRIGWTSFAILSLIAIGTGAAEAAVVSQIHNAPGWLPTHAYSAGQRVNSGPGWTGTAFVPYQPLAAYQAIGNCSSGMTAPTGTGTVSDGTCSWKYLSPTDYVSLTGFANDAPRWQARAYQWGAVVASGSPLTAYIQETTAGCTSTTAPPATASDGCAWVAVAPVVYTSGKSFIPWQTFNPSASKAVSNIAQSHEADLWNDQEYLIGQGNETTYKMAFQGGTLQSSVMSAAMFRFHNDKLNDSFVTNAQPSAGWYNYQAPWIVTAAPGESFADTLKANPNLPLSGYNPANGVALDVTATGNGLDVEDNSCVFRRLQMKNAAGLVARETERGSNLCTIEHSIIDAVGSPLGFGAMTMLDNDLVIVHGADADGIKFDYPGILAHSTIVCPDKNCGIGVKDQWNYVWFQGQTVGDNLIFGFKYLAAQRTNTTSGWQSTAWNSGNNFTDAAQVAPQTPTPYGWDSNASPDMFADPLPGTTYGADPSTVFVSFGGANPDYRLSPTSPAKGVGAAFGQINRCPHPVNDPSQPSNGCPFDVGDSTDILGMSRPATGLDVGAWQTAATSPALSPPAPPPETSVLLQMPSGITGTQPVNIGSGSQTIYLLVGNTGANVRSGWAFDTFSVSVSDGATTTPVTGTLTTTTTGDGDAQTFILNGNWGTVSQIILTPVGGQNYGTGGGMQNFNIYGVWAGPSGITPLTGDTSNAALNLQAVNYCYYKGNGVPPGVQTYDQNSVPLTWTPCQPIDAFSSEPITNNLRAGYCSQYHSPCMSKITGATNNGNAIPAGTLDTIVNNPTGAGCQPNACAWSGTVSTLPAGTFNGTSRIWWPGNEVHGAGMGQTVLADINQEAFQDKGEFDLEAPLITITDMTISGAGGGSIGENLSCCNVAAIYVGAGGTFKNLELTYSQEGIRGQGCSACSTNAQGQTVDSPVTISNSYIHDNGSRNSQTHEVYIAGGPLLTMDHDHVQQGDRSAHALKSRTAHTVVIGGQYDGCTDPTGYACGSVMDFPDGGQIDISGGVKIVIPANALANNNGLTVLGYAMEGAGNGVGTVNLSDMEIDNNSTAGPPLMYTNKSGATLNCSGNLIYKGMGPPVIQGFTTVHGCTFTPRP